MKIDIRTFISILLLIAIVLGFVPSSIPVASAAVPTGSANVVEIVLDYAKEVEIPKNTIYDSIEHDANTIVDGMLGIIDKGSHNSIVKEKPSVYCAAVDDSYVGTYGTFTRVGSGLIYKPTKFMGDIEKQYIVYQIKDSSGTTYRWLYIELRLIPATSMYYETSFSERVFDNYSTDAVAYVDTDNAFYADFTNTAIDQKRYEKNIYGGKNYDLAENWGAVDKDENGLAYSDPRIENGNLVVEFTGTNDHRSWIWAQANGDLNYDFTLNYHPHSSHVVQMRVKCYDLVVLPNKTPYAILAYFTGPDRWNGNTANYDNPDKEELWAISSQNLTPAEIEAFKSGEYFTVTFPVKGLKSDTHTLMSNLRFQIGNIKSKSSTALGGFAIDYVYVGPAYSAPENQPLYFDFGSTNEDLNHYGTHNYLSQNFDANSASGVAAGWNYSRNSVGIASVKVNEAKGTLDVTGKSGVNSFTFGVAYPIAYNPANAELLRMRLKLKNFSRNGSLTPQMTLAYWDDKGNRNDLAEKITIPVEAINSDKFITVEVPIPADSPFRAAKQICDFDFYVTGLLSSNASNLGVLSVDDLFIGSMADALALDGQSDHLIYDFGGNDTSTWTYTSHTGGTTVTTNPASGTIKGTVTARDPYVGIPYTLATDKYVLKEGDTVAVRLKVDSGLGSGLQVFFAVKGNGGYAGTKVYCTSVADFTPNGKYQTIILNPNADVVGKTITGLRVDIVDKYTENATGNYEIDYVCLGAKLSATDITHLYFDFKNTPADQTRYASEPSYAGKNYDIGNWKTAIQYNGSDSEVSHNIDNTVGTISCDVTSQSDAVKFIAQNLAFDPKNAEVFRVRFKIDNMKAGPNTSLAPFIRLWYSGNYNDETYGFGETYVSNENFITIETPLEDDFRNKATITQINITFHNLVLNDTTKNGKITIDYIYVGASENFEKLRAENNSQWQTVTDGTSADNRQDNGLGRTDNAIFFDFTNTPYDRVRYAKAQYMATNYDNSGKWFDATMRTQSGNATQTAVISTTNGTLTLTPKEGKSQTWTNTTKNSDYDSMGAALQFDPSYLKVFQVRFKVDDLTATGTPDVRLYLNKGDPEPSFVQSISFDASYIDSDNYLVLTKALGTSLNGYDTVTGLRINFVNMKNANDSTPGKITIDYIYVGPEDHLPTRHTYGFDSSYTDDLELSNGSSLFTEGRDIPRMNTNKSVNYSTAFTETSFTFTGKGFDIISRTGVNQGTIRAVVYDSDGYCVATSQVINKSDRGIELMQVPVMSAEMEKHDTYYVKIFVGGPYDYDDSIKDYGGRLDHGGEFFFDAVRIYQTIDTASTATNAANAYKVYQKHGEADASYIEIRNKLIDAKSFNQDGSGTAIGAVYLDAVLKDGTTFESKIAEYAAVGPNNEVYLAAGNAIAFKIEATGTPPASVDIGAKSADGSPVSMNVSVSTTAQSEIPTGAVQTLSTATALFYPLPIYSDTWKIDDSAAKSYYLYVTVHNNGTSGILSLTDIKFAYDAPKSSSTVRTVRLLTDEAMVRIFANSCDHIFTYTELGEEHTIVCANCSYTATETHNFVEGSCVCGAVESTEPIPDPNLKFSMNISVGAEMAVSYNIMASAVNQYADFYLEVSKENADSEPTVITYGLTEGHEPMTNMANVIYSATFTGISAKQMGDEFATTLYAVDENGKIHKGETVTESIKGYLLSKYDGSSDAFKTMAVDMLSYGAAAQTLFNYGTDKLVTSDLTEEQLGYATKGTPEATDIFATSGNGANVSVVVTVGSRVELGLSVFKAGLSNPENVRCEIRDADGKLLAEPEVTNTANVIFGTNYSNVGAREMRKPITATFYMGDTAISQTITWNVETYVAQTRANTNSTENDIAMVNAMLTYGDSVGAYLASLGQ